MQAEHHGSNWGSTGYRYSGAAISKVLDDRPYLRTALDYGCGKGTIAQMFGKLDWKEYDPGIPGKETVPSGQFDFVTCTDVLEHVERVAVVPVVKELIAKTGKVLFVDIACYETGKPFSDGPYKGQDIHITVREPVWWMEKFANALPGNMVLAEAHTIMKRSKGRLKERVQLIYERV